MSAGQWITSGSTRWLFDAGSESLDFAYTGAMDTGAMATGVDDREQLHSAVDLGHWLAHRFGRLHADDATDRDLTDAISLRDAIARIATASADRLAPAPDDVDTLNLFAATPDIPPAMSGGNRQAGASRIRVGQALATLARDAIAMFTEPDGDEHGDHRIRRCDADDCRMVFHDESRTNNRRWCSMQRCGNRAKVRAHRERDAMRRYEERTNP